VALRLKRALQEGLDVARGLARRHFRSMSGLGHPRPGGTPCLGVNSSRPSKFFYSG